MEYHSNSIIGEIVAADIRTAEVFSKHNIDYCCKGNRTLGEAALERRLSANALLNELTQFTAEVPGNAINYEQWPVDLLSKYIVQRHHKYVENAIPFVQTSLQKLCQVHGKKHPELFAVASDFKLLANDLLQHMHKEETILFPQIRELMQPSNGSQTNNAAAPGAIANPVSTMMDEHRFAGDLLASIKEKTSNYTVPPDGCTTYKATYAKLKEFQDDMFLHIHLENNILFPKMMELERERSMNAV